MAGQEDDPVAGAARVGLVEVRHKLLKLLPLRLALRADALVGLDDEAEVVLGLADKNNAVSKEALAAEDKQDD